MFLKWPSIYSLRLLVIHIIGLLLLMANQLNAQVMSKSLPEPQFYILGINAQDFPKYNGSWQDSNAVKILGVQIQKWLITHEAFKSELMSNKKVIHTIDQFFFKSLTPDEKLKFKEISKQLSYALKPQKESLIKEFEKRNPNTKGSKKNFYLDAEQIYFLHEDNLTSLKKVIRN